MKCNFCNYEFDDSLGRYGCPDCCGEGFEPMVKKPEPRKAHGIRLSEKEWKAIEKAAARAGVNPSEWMRATLRRQAGLDP